MAHTYKHLPLYQLSVTRRTGMTDKQWDKELRLRKNRNASLHLSHYNQYHCDCKVVGGVR